ncbi:serine/threonine-protein kinase PRKX [Metarhizium acridum CQMa 102]|uniref:cAMP-dependent protein kinase n=1 Tax=Metarhizium acridum (strain CQMa 102) TaxID=655827 RepID=E9DTH1_METAQ|nr:serine/threonine-protein kinase PRKX [Metarhizium acridum CQMa 102]EFY93026.1 serine/threonine-protein kinase PRKX [Metarhizium acridum CQMa 102]
MAATVAQSQAPANLPSNGLTSSAAPGSHAAHDDHSFHNCQAHSKIQGGQAESSPQTHRFEPSNFNVVRTLGTGTFARVCLVRPSNAPNIPLERDTTGTAQVYALKILRKTQVIKLKQVDHVRHERAVLADVAGHPFITNLVASFSDHDSLYMLLDYVPGGELFSYLRKFRRFDEATAQFYAAEIVLVLEYLHEQQGGVAYRDLKPENLLLDKDGHIKLVDFGFAKRLGYKGDHPVETYTLCGTPEYLAPEVIHNKGHTTAVDWTDPKKKRRLTGGLRIVEKPVAFPHDPPISDEAKDIICSFCTIDRSRRLGNISGGAARVKAHPFFRNVNWDDLLNRRQLGPIVPPIRYPGDSQCFDVYPEDDGRRERYTEEMARQYDPYFADF